MTQTITTAFHALDTSKLQNQRFVGIIDVGVYAGYRVRPNPGQTNLLDITRGADGVSILATSEGVVVTENEDILAAVAVEAADSALSRIDLVVAEYKFSTSTEVKQIYRVIKGKNQANSAATPVAPKVQNQFQIPLAYVTIRPQSAFSGSASAQVLATDVKHVPKAKWLDAPKAIASLKPEIDPNDNRRLYVYPGVMPNVDGTASIEFGGAYTPVLDPDTFAPNEERYFLVGITDEGLASFVGEAETKEGLPSLSVDILPVAIVLARRTSGSVRLVHLDDIRFTFSRRLAARVEIDDYKDWLASSVFQSLRVVTFKNDDLINLESVQLQSAGASSALVAVTDSTDTSLKVTWSGVSLVPSEKVAISTEDLLATSNIPSVKHFCVSADVGFTGLRFQFSTSSATAGFTTQSYRPGEIVRIPASGAKKLFIRFLIPTNGFINKVAKIFSFGVLLNLDGNVLNASTVGELGINALKDSATRNLIANGNFYYWSRYTSAGALADLSSQEPLSFVVSETQDEPNLADGWQVTDFGPGFSGDTARRVIRGTEDNSAATALEVVTAEGDGQRAVVEYRIPAAFELQGKSLTFALSYEISAPSSLAIGIAQYTRVGGQLTLKSKTETFANQVQGEVYVTSEVTVGPDVDQIGFYLLFVGAAATVTHKLWDARAAVGSYTVLPFTKTPEGVATLRGYVERGRAYVAQNALEGATLGLGQQLGTRKEATLGELVARTIQSTEANRSTNVGDLSYSVDADSVLVTAFASSAGLSVIDVDWEAFVRYQGGLI